TSAESGGAWKETLLFVPAVLAALAGVALGLSSSFRTFAAGGGLLLLVLAAAWWRHRLTGGRPCFFGLSWNCLMVGALALLGGTTPLLAARRLTHPQDYACQVVELPRDWLAAQALDLEGFVSRLLPDRLTGRLLAACAALSAALLVLAWRSRRP